MRYEIVSREKVNSEMYTLFFFFNDTATTESYTLSLHDALPICAAHLHSRHGRTGRRAGAGHPVECRSRDPPPLHMRSEEHTSELQSRQYLVCRLLLEKQQPRQYLVSLLLLITTPPSHA